MHALAHELRRRGHRVSVLASAEGLEGAPTAGGIEYWAHPNFFLKGVRSVAEPLVYRRRLAAFLKARPDRDRPDLVLAFHITYVAASRRAWPEVPVGYLTGGAIRDWYGWVHGHQRGLRRLRAKLKTHIAGRVEREALAGSRAVFVEVADVERRLRQFNADVPCRYVLWPTPVDRQRFRPDARARAEVRRELGLGGDERMVLGVGRLQWNKNFQHVLQALGGVTARHWRLVIVGEGPDAERLRTLAANLGVGDRLLLTGARPDPERMYAAADIFVHAALIEPYGNVVQEAAASGLACVVSPAQYIGFCEYLQHEVNALLADPHNLEAWKLQLTRVLADDALRARLGAGALALIASRPDWAQLTDVLLQAA